MKYVKFTQECVTPITAANRDMVIAALKRMVNERPSRSKIIAFQVLNDDTVMQDWARIDSTADINAADIGAL